MELNNFMDQLSALSDAVKKFEEKSGRFCSVYHEYLADTGYYWKMKAWQWSGERTNNRETIYTYDFNTTEDLIEHLQVLTIGAMLANGEEV